MSEDDDRKRVHVYGVRTSTLEQIDNSLGYGDNRSEWIREAIHAKLSRQEQTSE